MDGRKVLAGIAGSGLVAAAAHATVLATGGYGTAASFVTVAMAVGVMVGAMSIGAALAHQRLVLAVAIALGMVCGEAYALLATAERVVAARDASQAPLRDLELRYATAKATLREALATKPVPADPKRLLAAQARQQEAEAAVRAKATDRACRAECGKLLQASVDGATREVAAARRDISEQEERQKEAITARIAEARELVRTTPAPASVSPLADRLGVPAWTMDLALGGLLSLGVNGLGAALIGFAAHTRTRRDLEGEGETIAVIEPPIALASEPEMKLLEVKEPEVIAAEKSADEMKSEVVRLPPPFARHGNVVEFLQTGCEFASADETETVMVEQTQIIAAYRAWCRTQQFRPHDDATLEKMFSMICEQTHVRRVRHGGEVFWLGVALLPQKPMLVQRGKSKGARR